MAYSEFTGMTDGQLMNLFSVVIRRFGMIGSDADSIIKEMIGRGYSYDHRHREFLTCAEWNQRHGHIHPRDCADAD